MKELEQSILATFCFFDIFDYPLTIFELWKWQYNKNSKLKTQNSKLRVSDIQRTLDESEKLNKLIDSKNGFYFLKGREKIVQTRNKRYWIARQKFQKALKTAKLLAKVPFVKMIAVCNDLAYNNTPSGGDIDLFIITLRKRIWTTRFFCALLLKILGQRPTEQNKKDKICLSFFVTDDSLNLEPIANKPEASGPGPTARRDIYLVYWIDQLVPIYDESIYNKFRAANQWIKKFLPNSLGTKIQDPRQIKLPWFWLHSFPFNGLTERFYRWFQLKILPASLKQLLNKRTAVIANDKMLKFHKYDQREYFQRKFEEKLKWTLTKYSEL